MKNVFKPHSQDEDDSFVKVEAPVTDEKGESC